MPIKTTSPILLAKLIPPRRYIFLFQTRQTNRRPNQLMTRQSNRKWAPKFGFGLKIKFLIKFGRKKFGQTVKNKSDYKNAGPYQDSAHSRRAHIFVFIQFGSDGRVIAGKSFCSDAFLPHFVFVKIMSQKRRQNDPDKKAKADKPKILTTLMDILHLSI